MRVTKKDIQAINPDCLSIEQIDSKQLFIVEYPGHSFLYSYRTIVGFKQGSRWYITTERYSDTTTRQLNQFRRGVVYIDVDGEEFDGRVKLLRLS